MSNIVSVYGASARCLSKLQILFLFLLLICSPSLVSAYWDPSGLIVCSESDDQLEAQIISDGNGGTIFVWQDERNGNWDIYAQRVDISGTILWANGGIPICTVPNDQLNPHIAYDGNGGALITWSDNRGATSDIYAQRINSSGVIQWAENGVAISTLTSSNEYDPKIAFDGIDGAIIVWTDSRNLMYDIFAQKVNFEGIIQWIENGIVVCSEENNQSQSNIIKDGLGGVIVSWDDSREGNYYHCIYTQRIDASGSLLWAINGVGVTNIGDNRSHYSHQICSDGAGGVIVTWKDLDYDPVIKAQRISSTGIRLWGEYAANSIVWHSNLDAPQIISDGKGGAIIAWQDWRFGTWDIFCQRLNASGSHLWQSEGISVASGINNQTNPQLVTDCLDTGPNACGAVITWHDSYYSSANKSIKAKHISSDGDILWADAAVLVSNSVGERMRPQIVSDGSGGATVCWLERPGSYWDIYANYVDNEGLSKYLTPNSILVDDIPNDEGGWVRVSFNRSYYDDDTVPEVTIYYYYVYRRISDPGFFASISEEKIPLFEDAILGLHGEEKVLINASSDKKEGTEGYILYSNKVFLNRNAVDKSRLLISGIEEELVASPPGLWELVCTIPATQEEQYSCIAQTQADSAATIPYTVFYISAHSSGPVYFDSKPDSGYSIDNIAPSSVSGFAVVYNTGSGNELIWDPSYEPDLHCYHIYRGSSLEFTPGPETFAYEAVETSWKDDPSYDGWNIFYKITAVDIGGNESEPASPESVTGDDIPIIPQFFVLYQNAPNPFNPTTTIRFDLPCAVRAKLCVYNVKGELVSTIVDHHMTGGQKEFVWKAKDNRGQPVSSGIYFYRLVAGDFVQTKKMVLLR